MWNLWFFNKLNEYLHEILSKFTKGIYNLYMILYNQRASYNKTGIGYQPDCNSKSFMSIFIAKGKNNLTINKCNYCHNLFSLDERLINIDDLIKV